jgi:hypothetical protein
MLLLRLRSQWGPSVVSALQPEGHWSAVDRLACGRRMVRTASPMDRKSPVSGSHLSSLRLRQRSALAG